MRENALAQRPARRAAAHAAVHTHKAEPWNAMALELGGARLLRKASKEVAPKVLRQERVGDKLQRVPVRIRPPKAREPLLKLDQRHVLRVRVPGRRHACAWVRFRACFCAHHSWS